MIEIKILQEYSRQLAADVCAAVRTGRAQDPLTEGAGVLTACLQASGNRLDPNQARLIAMGGGPQLPPPRLAGITGAPVPSIPTYTPQITGLGPQGSMASQGSIAAGPTGGSYVPQPTGGYVPQVRTWLAGLM